MGGCRCSYRNCTVRSDGKTHLFHYPVFDKLRCRQWILNARKKELFDLTVCQLKNRVVCQHHFRNDMFMNEQKNQLIGAAIPTENGPYCTDNGEPLELSSQLSNAIDTRPTSYNKKKSSLTVKYGDFLTNKNEDNITMKDEINLENNIIDPKAFIEHEDVMMQPKQVQKKTYNVNKKPSQYFTINEPKNNKVKILSETILSEPLTFPTTGDLLDISKHDIRQDLENIKVEVFNNKGKNMLEINVPMVTNNNVPNQPKVEDNFINLNEQQYKEESFIPTVDNFINLNENHYKEQIFTPTHPKSPTKPFLKLTPERKAAIAEKRNFNMKLRDFIEAGLKNKSTPKSILKESISNLNKQTVDSRNSYENLNRNSKEQILLNDTLDNNPQVKLKEMFDYKLRNIENKLLRKIEENTRQIENLRKTVSEYQTKPSLAEERKSEQSGSTSNSLLKVRDNVSSQTDWTKKDHKKYLFNAISEYISEELKSSLYEELFLDNIVKNKQPFNGNSRRSKRLKTNTENEA